MFSEEDKKYVDSCLNDYHKVTDDTSRVQSLMGIVNNVWNDNVWPVYNRYIMHSILNSPPQNRSDAENKYLKKALAETINNEGFYYRNVGNIPLALELYHKSLKLLEELHDSVSMSYLYNNLGAIYQFQESYEMSLKYHQKSLDIKIAMKDSALMSYTFNNIGVVYQRMDSTNISMEYFRKGLDLFLKNNDIRGASRAYYNLGFGYAYMDSFELAKMYYEKSLAGYLSYEDEEGISMTSSGLGALEVKMKNYELAKKYAETGLKYAQELGHPDLIKNNSFVLYVVAKNTGDYKTALEMRNLEITMGDSLDNRAYIKQSADAEAKYEFEKQQAIKDTEHQAEIDKQQAISDAAKRTQNIIIIAISAGLLIVIIFSVFLTNRFRVTQKQKKIIEEQKHEVEEKNKEILDSIRYAKRIQNAILPSMDAMNKALKNGFVLFKPKDVVAGDFYWMEQVDNKVYFAAADCTGHGVPGAMVSVVCSNALSKALLEENADSTGNLLDRTRDIVINRLAKSGEEMKDGMDISLCAIDYDKMELQWSGANNPLWIIRDNELIEYKADKQPVGMHSAMKSFTTHTISILKDDFLYVMTDGFQDQFGGENGKKFKAAKLKEKILAFKNTAMEEQCKLLDLEFENWRKGFEQIDDVCIIGVRI
ncbi:MAG: tetratricopeptide repeat protein [Crocinitomicaceae bacterium]|nr:tetratricopeptide repeat protein [Crocinitomicaceae bacterium]